MNMMTYIKNSSLKIIYFICIFFAVNIVLLSSSPIDAQFTDIVYMDFLLIFISLVFAFVDYKRWKYSYKEIYEAVNNVDKQDEIGKVTRVEAVEKIGKADQEDKIIEISDIGKIDESLPNNNYYFEAKLIKDIVRLKNDEMEGKVQKVKLSLDEMNDYITKWVHEIKIPISVCELIADKIDQVDESEQLILEFDRIKFLINQVLYTSRSSSYSEDLQISEINMERLVKDVVKRNAAFFISKNIDLELRNIKYSVLSDEKWLAYIIDQIINNACKYVSKDGKINIYAEQEEKVIKLCIKDNGIGIKGKDIKRIFDRGFTGENGRIFAKSTGMGLYLAKKMAHKLSHDIYVESEEGQGTKFTICFYKLSDYFKVT